MITFNYGAGASESKENTTGVSFPCLNGLTLYIAKTKRLSNVQELIYWTCHIDMQHYTNATIALQ